MIAPPTPWTPRERFSIIGDCASPHASEAAVNTTSPVVKTRRRPTRSEIAPAVSRNAASVSA